MLKIINLKAGIDSKTILNKIDLNIKKGEFHVIMGRNGTGKSTLANILTGKENYEIYNGDILYNDDDIIIINKSPGVVVHPGAGNIGGSLSRTLVKDSQNYIVVVDNLSTGREDKLPSKSFNNWEFINANVNSYKDISSIISNGNFDYIFHYAAVVGVQRTLDNPMLVLDDILGIRNILDLALQSGVKRVFFSSAS